MATARAATQRQRANNSHESTCSSSQRRKRREGGNIQAVKPYVKAGGPSSSVVVFVTVRQTKGALSSRSYSTSKLALIIAQVSEKIRCKLPKFSSYTNKFKTAMCWTTRTSLAISDLLPSTFLEAEFTHPALSGSSSGSAGS